MGPLQELTQTDRSDIQQTGRGIRGKKKIFTKDKRQKQERGKTANGRTQTNEPCFVQAAVTAVF